MFFKLIFSIIFYPITRNYFNLVSSHASSVLYRKNLNNDCLEVLTLNCAHELDVEHSNTALDKVAIGHQYKYSLNPWAWYVNRGGTYIYVAPNVQTTDTFGHVLQ